MQVFVLILILILIAAAVSFGIVMRRRQAMPSAAPSSEPASGPHIAESPPMNDLESALAQVFDSAGRPIRDRIEAESDNVDHLRVPDDTGPLLRRALDHVANPVIAQGADSDAVADIGPDTAAAAGDDGTASEA